MVRSRMVILFTTFALVASGGCQHSPSQLAPPEPPAIPVSQPVSRQVTDYVDFTGRTDAVQAVDVRARVTGYLVKCRSRKGRRSRRGSAVRDRPAALPGPARPGPGPGRALQGLASSWPRLPTPGIGPSRPRRPAAVSQQQLDQDKAAVDEAEAQVKAYQASMEVYKLNLSFTKVTSPIDGQVSRYYLTLGNLVNQDQTLLTTVVSLDPMYAYFDMDEPTLLQDPPGGQRREDQAAGERGDPGPDGPAGRRGLPAPGEHQLRQQPGEPDHRQHLGPRRLPQPQAAERRPAAVARNVRAHPPADRPAAPGAAGHRPGHRHGPGPEVRLRPRRREQGPVSPRHDRPAPAGRPARRRGAEARRLGGRRRPAAGPPEDADPAGPGSRCRRSAPSQTRRQGDKETRRQRHSETSRARSLINSCSLSPVWIAGGEHDLALLHRPADLRGGAVHRHHPDGRDRAALPADRPVPADHAARGGGDDQLPGGQRPGGGRHGGGADRAAGQRRRGHALHVLADGQRRLLHADRHLRHRHRPEHGPGHGPEPRPAGPAAAAALGPEPGHHHPQEDARHPEHHQLLLAGRPLRRHLPEQLRHHPRLRRAAPHRRGFADQLPGRGQLQHARLARPAEAGVAEHDGHRRGQRHPHARTSTPPPGMLGQQPRPERSRSSCPSTPWAGSPPRSSSATSSSRPPRASRPRRATRPITPSPSAYGVPIPGSTGPLQGGGANARDDGSGRPLRNNHVVEHVGLHQRRRAAPAGSTAGSTTPSYRHDQRRRPAMGTTARRGRRSTGGAARAAAVARPAAGPPPAASGVGSRQHVDRPVDHQRHSRRGRQRRAQRHDDGPAGRAARRPASSASATWPASSWAPRTTASAAPSTATRPRAWPSFNSPAPTRWTSPTTSGPRWRS